jgi:hypothetical protein
VQLCVAYLACFLTRCCRGGLQVCDGVITYECYQTLTDGIYLLRLGGGLFGRVTVSAESFIT